MTSMEPATLGADPRLNFDDPLLDGLLILCKLHGATVSRASLSAGLPMAHQRLSLDLLPRAAARASLQARLLRRELADISPLNLPVMLILAGGPLCGTQALGRGWQGADPAQRSRRRRAVGQPRGTEPRLQWPGLVRPAAP